MSLSNRLKRELLSLAEFSVSIICLYYFYGKKRNATSRLLE